MRLNQLKNYYGTYTRLARELGIGNNTYQLWRKKGCIPYPMQLVIEKKTNGLFLASEEDAKPFLNER